MTLIVRKILLLLITIVSILSVSCSALQSEEVPIELSAEADSLIKNSRGDIQALTLLYNRFAGESDYMAMLRTSNMIAILHRDEARFLDAIEYNKQSLEAASILRDTVEMIYCYNHIATNFRRLGVLDEASTYHFKALSMAEQYSDHSSPRSKRMTANTLNGIGNIYLTLNNYSEADSMFRLAMKYESERDNSLGLAINYANIGSIFERMSMLDSARSYYLYSLAYNEQANSDLGRALCYIHLGDLSEAEGELKNAKAEYSKAFAIMSVSSDKWHRLESMLAMSRVDTKMGFLDDAESVLCDALELANEIKSWEHLARIHRQYYKIALSRSDYKLALEEYISSISYNDSVTNSSNEAHLLNTRVKYEREKSMRAIEQIRSDLDKETSTSQLIITCFIVFGVLFLVAFISLLYALRMKQKSESVLKRMELVRNNFFTNITHEFRTPLTIIRGMTEMLSGHEKMSKSDISDCLESIDRQCASLLELVNQLLDISKASSEIEEPEWRNGDVVAHLRMIIDGYKVYARQKFITLDFYSDRVSLEVDFVPSYLTKIVRNLVSNALKYTPKGGTVKVMLRGGDNHYVVEVSDSGIGLRKEEAEHVFDLFYQAGDTRVSGSGVGLALVKRLVDRVKGTIKVSSTHGVGTTFVVTMVRKYSESKLQKWIPNSSMMEPEVESVSDMDDTVVDIADEDNDTRPLIMVVDDNKDIARYIGSALKYKYRLLFADDGLEGLSKAQEYVPDLLITDLMMPEMNGYDLCRRVRKSDVISHIPIIILSAKCTEEDRIKGYEVGADAYLIKPFNSDELNARVAVLLEQRRMLRCRYTQTIFADSERTTGMIATDIDFMTKLNDFISLNIGDRSFTVEMLAERMCMSVSQLSRKMKNITGMSPANYIMHVRLEKGKRLLSLSDKPIGDIAFECGFTDTSHFGRIFKQTYNMTPSQYRKMPKVE